MKNTLTSWAIVDAAGSIVKTFDSRAEARDYHATHKVKGNKVEKVETAVEGNQIETAAMQAAPKIAESFQFTSAEEKPKTLADKAKEIAKAPAKTVTIGKKKAEKPVKPVTDPAVLKAAADDFAARLAKGDKACPTIWAVLDAHAITRKDLIAIGVANGINKGTLGQQTYLWSKAAKAEAAQTAE